MMTDSRGFEARVAVATVDRRANDRVRGPFDGWRVSGLEMPVRIYDISLGGCFVNAMHEQEPGVLLILKVHLPYEGWLELKAETLYRRPGYGYAVRFIHLNAETRDRLEHAIERVQDGGPPPF